MNKKFRAWPKAASDTRMLFRGLHDRNWYFTPTNDEDGCNTAYPAVPEDRARMEIMQFTGLLDKNGKEIYEGDIVRIKGSAEAEIVSAVTFDHAGACITDGKYKDRLRVGVVGNMEQERGSVGTEVIGNIHENSDLLNE